MEFKPEHYEKKNGIIFRKEDSPELGGNKNTCLKDCICYFTNCNSIYQIKDMFRCDGETYKDWRTRCCCSQHVHGSINYHILEIPQLKLKFALGGVCMPNLLTEEKVDKKIVKEIFKETCKECGEKIKRRNNERQGFCKMACKKKYDERERNKPPVNPLCPKCGKEVELHYYTKCRSCFFGN